MGNSKFTTSFRLTRLEGGVLERSSSPSASGNPSPPCQVILGKKGLLFKFWKCSKFFCLRLGQSSLLSGW